MMKKFFVIFLSLFILIPFMPANASPGNTELVLENIQIKHPYPINGELSTITGDVYNAGIMETDSLTSIITAAFFVDGNLLYVDEIGNIKPGIGNKITISSGPIWDAEVGEHTIKIIVDYHDTLKDQFDSPDDNVVEKVFSIKPFSSMNILLDTTPSYVREGENTLLQVLVSVVDSDSNLPLDNKKIILSLDGEEIKLTSDKNGKSSFSKTVNSFKPINVKAHFEGDDQYYPSDSSLLVYSIPKEVTSAIIMKIVDNENRFNFENNSFEFLIFQDSYENLIENISPSSTMLDSNAFLISLSPEHDYFSEVYLNGKFLFLTDIKPLKENQIIVEEVIIPQSAEIRFRIINEIGEPENNVIVNSWKYSTISDENGLTDWLRFLPSPYDKPYDAEIILPDQKTITVYPFLVFSGERKTIELKIKNNSILPEIPNWIRNNAGWWAEEQIDDKSFVEGIQYLMKEGIMKIPQTTQGEDTGPNVIPGWIKNNAGWWANGDIDDTSFVEGIQFLIKKGILII